MDPPPDGSVELIYVDSASTDDSVERACQLEATVIKVNPQRPCAAVGRNAGWRAAQAELILFLDGDTILAPDFVNAGRREFEDANVAVVFGDRREIDTDNSIYNRMLDLDWIAPPGTVELCGGDALIRREVLVRVNGYDEELIAGEDADLSSRIRALGYKIIHVDRRMVGHDLAIHRFTQYWRRSVRTGYAYAEISERFRDCPTPVWSREASRNRLQGTFMLIVILGSPMLGIAMKSVVPFGVASLIISALALRSALRSRWKRAGLNTRIIYGLHSHLGQIPILFGQLRYLRDRLGQRTAKLIEYK